MKKIIVLSVFIMSAVIIFFACTKENNETKNVPEKFYSNNDDGFFTKVLKFKQRMDFVRNNPEYKDGEQMSADSAVFYMEAAMNFVYGYNNLPDGKIEIKTSVIDFPDDEILNSGQIASKLNEIVQTVAGQYNEIQLSDKHLSAVDLKITGNGEDRKLEVTSATKGGEGSDDIPHDWWYGGNAGTCDNSNIFEGDAAQQLQTRVSKKFKEYPPEGCTYLFYLIDTKEIDKQEIVDDYINPADETPEDNYLDYLVFYANEQNTPNAWVDSVKCISANIEMPFYDNSYTQIVSDFITEHQGKKFKEFKVKDYIDGKNSGSEVIWHKLTVIIGKRLTDCGPIPDTIPSPIGE